MARNRKSKADREREYREADRRVWNEFSSKMSKVQTFIEAQILVNEAVPPDSPGRRYYSNLGFFLQAFTVPYGSNYDERVLYLEFIRRLDQSGQLKPGAREKIEDDLKKAMSEPIY